MKDLNKIGEDLFNKLRGKFPKISIGDTDGNVTSVPKDSRFFDIVYDKKSNKNVSISLDDSGLVVMYSSDIINDTDDVSKSNWYEFLKELRAFAKKRMLNFDTRDLQKSNLDKRDYKFLANNKIAGENTMSESKLYGTSRVSYQNIDGARLVIKHNESINQELAAGRTRSIGKIYIESADGERFMYPFKHLSGARAMARHVAEGGKPFDDFGTHIVSLSEELNKLRKFKNYMGRSAVMAESLAGYMDAVYERISTVKKTIESLQKANYYKESFAAFEKPMMEDVPSDVAENWIDQLTIKQFNEELADVFPYIYKLVSEVTKAKELGPDDLSSGYYKEDKAGCSDNSGTVVKTKEEIELEQAFEQTMGQFAEGASDQEVMNAFQSAAGQLSDIGGYGEPDMKKVMALVTAGKIEDAADEFVGEFTDKDGGEVRGANGVYTDLVQDLLYATGADGSPQEGNNKEEKEQKTPLGEFILSYFDRDQGTFPKGETAVLTMVEKDYGEQFIEPAKAFIEQVGAKFEEIQMRTQPQQLEKAPDVLSKAVGAASGAVTGIGGALLGNMFAPLIGGIAGGIGGAIGGYKAGAAITDEVWDDIAKMFGGEKKAEAAGIAHAKAAKAGEESFEFNGKEYPVTLKSTEVGKAVEELKAVKETSLYRQEQNRLRELAGVR